MDPSEHYDRLAGFDLLRRRFAFWAPLDLAVHRRISVPEDWRRANPREPASSYLYDWIGLRLNLAPGMHVLDIGCGFGAGLARLHRRFGITGVGITSSTKHAQVGTRHHAALPGVRIELGTFDEQLAGSYDAAIAVESLVHARSITRTVAYIAAALRPTAPLAIVDDLWRDPGQLTAALRARWSIVDPMTRDTLKAALRAAGLEPADHADLTPEMITVSIDAARRSRRALRAARRALPSRAHLWDFYDAQLELHRRLADGALAYEYVTARKRDP